ncbi:hypothetical protein E2C01_069830 [Portunus trituberculatus]|uniref:Uncharacterized protein n=1 Tax=Portunus trituberculatus TaxID=210409 RepID=A0A5B7HZL7_PORTR|nr:hypothetical protein [Portunus trituberculatus]
MEGVSKDHLYYNLRTWNPLLPMSLSRLLCQVIESTDPGHAPHAHNIRGLLALLALLHTHLVERVQDLRVSLPRSRSYSLCSSYGDGSTSLTSEDKRWKVKQGQMEG